ncbi:MAG: M20/M25/M40 family metallo-hydrolase [Firmicutes bacterium]|nr:M20/M25/M40 family metallo-hydrolase [Bacillota bacterium]
MQDEERQRTEPGRAQQAGEAASGKEAQGGPEDPGRGFLLSLSRTVGVSGHEDRAAAAVEEGFTGLADEIRRDRLGNLVLVRRARRAGPEAAAEQAPATPRPPRIMLAAHMDEVGLVITQVDERGFLRFTAMGGVDQRILPAQMVRVHSRQGDLPGVIGAKPPHIQTADEQKRAIKMEDLFIDVGYDEAEARRRVSVGDMASIDMEPLSLRGQRLAGKSLDDRAGVAAMFVCLRELQHLQHSADVFAVATVQEEVSRLSGAATCAFELQPDIGLVIDVGFGDMPGQPEDAGLKVGGGPAIGIGPHVHPKLFARLKELAERWHIPYSLEPSPTPAGTDAYGIQITQAGVPTALISLPLRYMHTPVELLDWRDVQAAGQLLALFIASVDAAFVEGLRCF